MMFLDSRLRRRYRLVMKESGGPGQFVSWSASSKVVQGWRPNSGQVCRESMTAAHQAPRGKLSITCTLGREEVLLPRANTQRRPLRSLPSTLVFRACKHPLSGRNARHSSLQPAPTGQFSSKMGVPSTLGRWSKSRRIQIHFAASDTIGRYQQD